MIVRLVCLFGAQLNFFQFLTPEPRLLGGLSRGFFSGPLSRQKPPLIAYHNLMAVSSFNGSNVRLFYCILSQIVTMKFNAKISIKLLPCITFVAE